jgi:ferric-dicitrate binding protein FerR (iron transport regulator)
MEDHKELLKKFWAGNATEPEKLQLYKLIIEQEEKLCNSPNQNVHEIGEDVMLDPGSSQKILATLHKEINSLKPHAVIHSRSKLYRILKPVAVAAAILAAIFLAMKWPFQPSSNSVVKQEAISPEKTISNNGSHILVAKLADSSLVSIYPGSSISYHNAFNTGNERLVQLKGKASFKVQHNASKPFRVIAGQVMTTDIGTAFCIDALQADIVKVKLIEGIIRVEALPAGNLAMNRKMQQPGQELNINLVTSEITTVEPFKNAAAAEKAVSQGREAMRAKQRLSFNRTALAEVFTRLSQREQVTIKFNRKDVDGLTFTGNIEPKDPLDLSLNVLCGLNGLSYTKTARGIAITKNK